MEITKSQLYKNGIYPIREEDEYQEFADETYDTVKIHEYEYPLGQALRAVDHVAYMECVREWVDCEVYSGALVEVDGEHYLMQDIKEKAPELHEEIYRDV